MAGKVKVEIGKKSEGEEEDERPLGVDIINGVQKDGERLLLGLSGWLRKAEARSIDWKVSGRADVDAAIKQREEETKEMREAIVKKEQEKWAQVVGKVEERFGEIVRKLEGDVHEWYVGIRETEGAEVMRIYTDVKSIAQKAQGDLGLDYAWLEDVTYNDWQRYHELMRVPERFLQAAKEMQEGTSTEPASPEDPLIPALDALNADLQDVVRGFLFSLANTRSRATRAFSPRAAGTEDEESDGFFSVNDGERRRDDLRGEDLNSVKKGVKEGTIAKKVGEGAGVLGVKEKAEEVKILPIDNTPKRAEEEVIFDASTVVIGKDKVQVEQALKDIPLETPAEVRHEEL
ncbi:hypothetical protein NLJ89_g4220 [Agrocybe chaxingu]|uniref:Uncharacterized protein n=1 Tax=Agrocybe chaxingu TaxID=84603 RepID=A0A9W8KA01_9AGAR|nr:hypothetical protein NLJ89_g4220 [Agrocybe chaxingu]